MKDQQITNLHIVHELLSFLLDNPELRFIQALWALRIVDENDRFYEPSKKTLERVRVELQRHLKLKGGYRGEEK